MKLSMIKNIGLLTGMVFMLSSCFNDLDVTPIDQDVITADRIFEDPAAYQQNLAKIYAGLAVTGQQGPAGQADISGIDEGFGQYLRMYWYMQELTTDEAIIGWDDGTIKDLHGHKWTSSDVFISAMYYRIMFQVTMVNEFLRESTEEKLNSRGVDANLRQEIATYRAEARFMRALSYWHALDLFGVPPFVTDEDPVGSFFPEQVSQQALFEFIESELLETAPLMADPMANDYGRADRAAAWMLLAKLYLNAEIYTGTARWADCMNYVQQVIGAGYNLDDNYSHLFLADNNTADGIIFPITYDGINTRTFGGTTFIINASVGGDIPVSDIGIDNGWGGTRTTSALVNKFDENDVRPNFFTDGQSLEIENVSNFQDGYAVTKFRNITSTGERGSDPQFADTDFPMFRLADAYLMYAEVHLRGGGGDLATAVDYVNQLRNRAFEDGGNEINTADLDLPFLIDERARELLWECHRRTDLIRFGLFTSGYNWPWKGDIAEGADTPGHLNLFPIPAADLAANPNLEQNSDQY